jgi:hypothetical protein
MFDCYFLAFFGFFFSRFGAFLFAIRIVCHDSLRLARGNETDTDVFQGNVAFPPTGQVR